MIKEFALDYKKKPNNIKIDSPIRFRDSLLGRTSSITSLDLRDASNPDDDTSSDE